MKHKRLNRDGWGFTYYPYYQMRIDDELFHGLACLIKMTDGEENYWETPKAGRVQVTGAGMSWLEILPDDTSRVITVMYFPEGTHGDERNNYPLPSDKRYQSSIYYVDITEGIAARLTNYIVTRKGNGVTTAAEPSIMIQDLASRFKARIAEPYYCTYNYEESLQDKPIELTSHYGQEFDIILKGQLKIQIGDHTEILSEGDSVYYDSTRPHGMIAVGGKDCEFCAVILHAEDVTLGDHDLHVERIHLRCELDERPSLTDPSQTDEDHGLAHARPDALILLCAVVLAGVDGHGECHLGECQLYNLLALGTNGIGFPVHFLY